METLLKSVTLPVTIKVFTKTGLEIDGSFNKYQDDPNPANDAIRINFPKEPGPDRFIKVSEIEGVFVG